MTPPLSNERVLSTLEADGKRRWLNPRLAKGRFLRRRRIVGFALIALFVLLPFVKIGGRPAFLIDLLTREISLFGAVFRPSDGVLLMLLGLSIAVTVFLVTALFGRVWCGWACPQSVYLEHVFRPIERRFAKHPVIKWAIYVALSFGLANVFLAYFVGVARLEHWVIGSPLEHVGGFMVVVVTTALVLFDFAYFREQTCILACPYGRLQSVLLDRQSLVVGYDPRRGEPRGKPRKKLAVLETPRGDCVDCGACVQVCPTGIDIRDGLQMECIGCAQCIDACDTVMDKLQKPRGLIRYTSQDRLAGKPGKLLRVRTIAYPAILALVVSTLVIATTTRPTTTVWIDRHQGPSFIALPGGQVASQIRIKLENATDVDRRYRIALAGAPDATLRGEHDLAIGARASLAVTLYADVAAATFAHGRRIVQVVVSDGAGFEKKLDVTLLGPVGETP